MSRQKALEVIDRAIAGTPAAPSPTTQPVVESPYSRPDLMSPVPKEVRIENGISTFTLPDGRQFRLDQRGNPVVNQVKERAIPQKVKEAKRAEVDPKGRTSFEDTGLEVDHLVSVGLGGTADPWNLLARQSKKTISQTVFDFFTGKERLPGQYKPENRQEGKMIVEKKAIDKYRAGEITLFDAMAAVQHFDNEELVADFLNEPQTIGQLEYFMKPQLDVAGRAIDFIKTKVKEKQKKDAINSIAQLLATPKFKDAEDGVEHIRNISELVDQYQAITPTMDQEAGRGAFKFFQLAAGGRLGLPSEPITGREVAATATLPVRWVPAELARLAVGMGLELTGSDLQFSPSTDTQKYIMGERDFRRIVGSDDMYGMTQQLIQEKMEAAGVNSDDAYINSLAGVLLFGAVVENPFFAFSKKLTKEAGEVALRQLLEREVGRGLVEEEIELVTKEATRIADLKVGEQRVEAAKDFVQMIKERPEPIKEVPVGRTQVEASKIPETLEKIDTEITKRIESFRKESGLLAEREGAGVRLRTVEDATGGVEFVTKDFSLARAKASMKRQADSMKKYSQELLYENDIEFRSLIDDRDKILERKIDSGDLGSIPFLDEEISKLETNIKQYGEEPIELQQETLRVLEGSKKQATKPTAESQKATGRGQEIVQSTEERVAPRQPKPRVEPVAEAKEVKEFEESFTKGYNEVNTKTTDGGGFDGTLHPVLQEGPEQLPVFHEFRRKMGDLWLNTREFVENDWERVRRLMERTDVKVTDASNPYEAEIRFHGRIGTRVEDLTETVKLLDKEVLDVAKKHDVKDIEVSNAVNKYLVARHAPERNAKIGESAAGITTKRAKEILKEIESSDIGPDVIKIADELQALNNKTLDILLEGEVISEDLYKLLRETYKNHIPLNRVMEDTVDIGQSVSSRPMDVRSTGIKRAKGSDKEVADVFVNITANHEQALLRAEKNRVDLATLHFARDNKELGLFEEVKPPQIPVAKITHKEAIDEGFFNSIISYAESLGAKVTTKGQPGRRLGYFKPATDEVVRAVATPTEVISHEVGHFLDSKFGLKQRFYKRGASKEVAQEMINWMKEIGQSAARTKSVDERFAHSFEFWLVNRNFAEEGLPLFSKKMDEIISEIPELAPILDIKPTGKFVVQGTPEVIFKPSVDILLRDPTILAMREKGEQVFLKIKDPNLAVAFRGVNRYKLDGIMRVLGSITRFYSGLQTRFNPEFAFPNKIRDLQESMVYAASKGELGFAGAVKVPLRDTQSMKAVTDFIRSKDTEGARMYKQLKDDGGTTGGLGLSTRKQVELDLESIRKINRSKPREAAETLVRGIDNWNTIFEDSTRLSVYREAIDRGATRERAAVLAKEASVNFNKMGRGGPVINAMYMFSNASIQGSVKMLRAMKNTKVAATVVTAVGGSVFAVNQWNDRVDPDWRDKVTTWDRFSSLSIVIPTDDGVTYVSIPVSWGMKPIKVAADYAYDLMAGESTSTSDAFAGVLASIIEGYNPAGGTDLTSAITPTLLDLPVDIARNKAWFGGKIRPDWDRNAPPSIQYFGSLEEKTTGKVFIGASKGLSGVGIEVSPANMSYAYEQIIGGAGRVGSKFLNTMAAIAGEKDLEVRETPFVSRFLRVRPEDEVGAGSDEFKKIRKTLQEQSRERFYIKQEAEEAHKQIISIPTAEAEKLYQRLREENPTVADEVDQIFKDEKKNLNYLDRLVKQLGVSNGERATYIKTQIDSMDTNEEKKKLWDEYVQKGLVSDQVSKQIADLYKE